MQQMSNVSASFFRKFTYYMPTFPFITKRFKQYQTITLYYIRTHIVTRLSKKYKLLRNKHVCFVLQKIHILRHGHIHIYQALQAIKLTYSGTHVKLSVPII